jgi:hypothetical protein
MKTMRLYCDLYEEQVKRSNGHLVPQEARINVGSPILGKKKLDEAFAPYRSRRRANIQPRSELDAYLEENFIESSVGSFDILKW